MLYQALQLKIFSTHPLGQHVPLKVAMLWHSVLHRFSGHAKTVGSGQIIRSIEPALEPVRRFSTCPHVPST